MVSRNKVSAFVVTFLIVGFFFLTTPDTGNAGVAPLPPCPCDTVDVGNGMTGNDIVEQICPGGNLGENSTFTDLPDQLLITLGAPPNSTYDVTENNLGDEFCFINIDGEIPPPPLAITEDEYDMCRESLTIRCGFGPPPVQTRDVPTLSEWGLIAMAGVLGIVGFMVIRRKQATA